jgi:hypothetical protein
MKERCEKCEKVIYNLDHAIKLHNVKNLYAKYNWKHKVCPKRKKVV